MGKKVQILAGKIKLQAVLGDSKQAKAIYDSLPIEGKVNTWGEEIYFSIPVDSVEAPDTEEVAVGTLGYWPPGRAFCIFFGRTPASTSDKPRAASAIVVVGEATGNLSGLKKVKDGESVELRT
ncbi:hypothetical protein CMO96_04755 [Candidatus Woesebacteria bacterium]|nr:hypothetical protein [Candidatus Woesebacteria bacterium]